MKRLYLEAIRPLLKEKSQAAEPSSLQLGRISIHGRSLQGTELRQQERFTTMQEVQSCCLAHFYGRYNAIDLVHAQETLPNILLPGSCPSGHRVCLAGALHCHAE